MQLNPFGHMEKSIGSISFGKDNVNYSQATPINSIVRAKIYAYDMDLSSILMLFIFILDWQNSYYFLKI